MKLKGSYFYKNKEYKVLATPEMKHADTGEWMPAVVYWDPRTMKTYWRLKKDFESKFIERK